MITYDDWKTDPEYEEHRPTKRRQVDPDAEYEYEDREED